MKAMADELRSLGEELPDRHLVLTMLRGLNKKFDHMKAIIKRSTPFPSFQAVWKDLELEEFDMETEGATSAFYTSSSARQQ